MLPTARDVQLALLARGYDIGKHGADGDIGPATLSAIMLALAAIPIKAGEKETVINSPIGWRIVPDDWMPWAKMRGIIVHWTAGSNKVSSIDKKHYHVIIDGDGSIYRGDRSIKDNESAADGLYAAHTRNCNTGFIGVSLAGMAGAVQSPLSPGKTPITAKQWQVLPKVLADLCRRYSINPGPTTVLSHAEVEKTLGIKQAGKWDIAILPFMPSLNTAKKVGDDFRAKTLALL